MENGKKPAFAKAAFYHPEGGIDSPQQGLTKREYFAGLAIQGLLASPNFNWEHYEGKDTAKDAIEIADALLAELDKPTKTK